jgi:hypothetical protein
MSLNGASSLLSKSGPPRILLYLGDREIQSFRLSQASEQHRSFILSTWVKSYEGMARKQGIRDAYALHEPGVAEARWADCTVMTDDDGYTVYAWICGYENGIRDSRIEKASHSDTTY